MSRESGRYQKRMTWRARGAAVETRANGVAEVGSRALQQRTRVHSWGTAALPATHTSHVEPEARGDRYELINGAHQAMGLIAQRVTSFQRHEAIGSRFQTLGASSI